MAADFDTEATPALARHGIGDTVTGGHGDTAVEGIVALVQPEAVLLFGSRARDDGDDASDWDLLDHYRPEYA